MTGKSENEVRLWKKELMFETGLTFVIRTSTLYLYALMYYTKRDCLLWCGSLSMSCRFICISSHGNLPLPLQYFH